MDSALSMILNHVEATARASRHLMSIQDDSGMTDAEWWSIVAPALEQVMDDDELVVSGRVGTAVGEQFQSADPSPDHALSFGLETILDGIQLRLDRQ